MIRGLFTAASGMIIQERRQTNTTNNLSNAATTGFKMQELISKETHKSLIQNRESSNNGNSYMRNIGELSLGAEIDEVYSNFEQGMLKETTRDTDLAIEGEGFFKVQFNELQIGYTRNGHFKIDSQGYLTTEDGKRVLTKDNSPILAENKVLSVSEDGAVFLDGEEEYALGIVNIGSSENLNAIGSGYYLVENAQEIVPEDVVVHQRMLEQSNVNPLKEMVRMIEISRSYESNQKVLQAIDEMLGKSVNSVGKI